MKLELQYIIFIIIIILSGFYLTKNYRKIEESYVNSEFIIKEDNNDLFINPYLTNKEPNLNIIKKYSDSKINIINNLFNENKTMYDIPVSSSNTNANQNNLRNIISFLI